MYLKMENLKTVNNELQKPGNQNLATNINDSFKKLTNQRKPIVV